uniref:SCP domain-containing protein n=1 Tax=Glossina palpalis gambiensis TaxID=67801 RepID=A0A1B0B3S2_9MUSC
MILNESVAFALCVERTRPMPFGNIEPHFPGIKNKLCYALFMRYLSYGLQVVADTLAYNSFRLCRIANSTTSAMFTGLKDGRVFVNTLLKQETMPNIVRNCFLFAILLLNFMGNPVLSWEYCAAAEICAEEYGHSLCNPIERFDTSKAKYFSSQLAAFAPVTKKFKRIIIDIHNHYRNLIAGGGEQNVKNGGKFPIASRMRALIWDDELEYNAKLHLQAAKRMVHDNCRATKRYPLAGQNLGGTAVQGREKVFQTMLEHFRQMFNEKDDVGDPEKLPDQLLSEHLGKSGHFTQLVGDRNSRVGCVFALGLNCTASLAPGAEVYKFCYYTACHYDFSNLTKWRLYKTHLTTPGADCGEWHVGMNKDPRYPNLCEPTIELFDYTDSKG